MNLKTRVLIGGGVLGALLGVGAAYLYLRTVPVDTDGSGHERLPTVHPGKLMTVLLSMLTVAKQIVGLGQRD